LRQYIGEAKLVSDVKLLSTKFSFKESIAWNIFVPYFILFFPALVNCFMKSVAKNNL